jgi:hypothetical protein
MDVSKRKQYVIMKAYRSIPDVDQKIGNLAVYTDDNVDGPNISKTSRDIACGKAVKLGHKMINKSAREDEMVRFFRYYFTILAKPELNYNFKLAYKENNIQDLEKKYGIR